MTAESYNADNPLITIGLPVYNGADHIGQTIESLLGQTFTDFEVVVSDNASTDGTLEILRDWEKKDNRIRVYAELSNRGGAWNFNRVVELARGEYFRWAGHDDLIDPNYLRACIDASRAAPRQTILVHTRTTLIDGDGKVLSEYDDDLNLTAAEPRARFARLVNRVGMANPIFGLMRLQDLKTTNLLGKYPSADLVLLGELAIRGQFLRIEQGMFFRRVHPKASWRAAGRHEGFAAWFDPARESRIVFPTWRLYLEFIKAAAKAPVSAGERLALVAVAVARWPWFRFKRMAAEIKRIPRVLLAKRS